MVRERAVRHVLVGTHGPVASQDVRQLQNSFQKQTGRRPLGGSHAVRALARRSRARGVRRPSRSRFRRGDETSRVSRRAGGRVSRPGQSARRTRSTHPRDSTRSRLRRVEIRQRREEKRMSPALSVYRLCLRCGPNVRACERARGGKTCPAPKMTCASRERHDELVEEWHRKLVERRACHYPVHFPRRGGYPPSDPPGDSEGGGDSEGTRGESRDE